MLSLDGIIQGPGGPEEDNSDGFIYGGWVSAFSEEVYRKMLEEKMKPADLLLGRKTFNIWENYWPVHELHWPGINEVTKYVLSTTRYNSKWQNTVFLSGLDDIRKLKEAEGANIKIWGSSELVQLLLQHNLIDELQLIIHPLLLGNGKKLFANTAFPRSLTLIESFTTPKGVIFANYQNGGDVRTGTIQPSDRL